MGREHERRYGWAEALAEDLERYLKDEPIQAKRPTMVQKIKKWARRKPAVAGLVVLSAVAILLLGVVVGGFMLFRENKEQQQIAEQAREAEAQQRQIAEAARAAEAGQRVKAERFQYFRNIALAGTAWRESNTGRLELLLDDCPPDYRHRWEWQYLKRQCHADLLTLGGHPDGGIRSLAFSPDGKRLASARAGGKVKLWDTVTGLEERTPHGHTDEAFWGGFSPDGMRLASGGVDGTVRLWQAATGREEQSPIKAHADWVVSVAFNPDGTRLASASFDQTIKVWEVATGR